MVEVFTPPKEEGEILNTSSSSSANEPSTATATTSATAITSSTAVVPKTKQRKTVKKEISQENSQEFIQKYKIDERMSSYKKPLPLIKSSEYYLDNRQQFILFINKLFEPYKKDIEKEQKSNENQCEQNDENDISPMTHQKVIKEYVNLYTPYRGLLLYHGLGAGKTCASIGMAEGMKTSKDIIIMTPASLQMN